MDGKQETASWLDYISVEQLPEDYQLLARIIGLELTIRVAEALPKVHLYFKSPERLFLPAKEAYARARLVQFPGIDRRRLALEAGLSERHIYDMVAEEKEKKQGLKQDSLF